MSNQYDLNMKSKRELEGSASLVPVSLLASLIDQVITGFIIQ